MIALMTVGEAAETLSVSRRSLYRMVKDGRIVAVRLGNGPSARLRIPTSSVANFVEPQTRATDELGKLDGRAGN